MPLDPKDDPNRAEFWEREEEELVDILFDNGVGIYQHGYDGALDQLAGINVSFPDLGIAVDLQAERFAQRWAFNMGKEINNTSRRYLQREFNAWIQSGEPLKDLINTIQGSGLFSPVRAEMIAVTEVTRIYALSNIEAWADTGVVQEMRWQTARDDLVCPICRPLHNKLTDVRGREFVGIDENDEEVIRRNPPAHVRCILPGNEVLAPGMISAASKSFYNGRCIEIAFSSGRKISVTQHHPILTTKGWIFAGDLNQGDKVYRTVNGERIASLINPDNITMPAPIEEVFKSLEMSPLMGSVRVPASPKDFYGDGESIPQNTEIKIIYINGKLRGNGNPWNLGDPYPVHKCRHGILRGISRDIGHGSSSFDFLSMGNNSPPSSSMGSRNLISPLLGAHPAPFGRISSRSASNRDIGLQEPLSKRPAIDTSLSSKFILRFSRDITLDKIVKIRDFNFSGHVYDLQVDDYELYFVNDIITHNCRCWIQPVVSIPEVE